MGRVAWGFFACASVICSAHAAAAQDNHWYVEGSAGALARMDAGRSTTFSNSTGASGPGTDTGTFDTGIVANLGLGYRLPLGFRVEGEVGYAHYSANSATPVSTNGAFPALNGRRFGLQSGGGFDLGSVTANAFYDLPLPEGLVPYIGGGVGAALSGSEGGVFGTPGARLNQGGGSAVWPVILGEVGLNMAFNAHWAMVPSYRFEHVFSTNAPYNANIFKLGLRYSW